ncbi:hypothetical protein SARC_05290 [Sphaeroforma arctica JP610]|uniref:Hemolysin III n=1 Tax=Sphaeroforma arctica JP610 TaxID=667725 RepID=A0A0L0G0N7_9EUKA|nr:hypothetical protein SARC_05290 [Sphaeroforma arctica JP610]KNC82419.1 hypothetical protein SARC_05290 [Sphaeroforma arctica JP610]|eukprot:XP_014156321.1 hypothetical protein SARC_05290 [Sphaeroforma arctica JP610]
MASTSSKARAGNDPVIPSQLRSRTHNPDETYVAICEKQGIKPNAAVRVALNNEFVKVLEIFPDQFEVSELPALGEILKHDTKIEYVKMPNCQLGATLCYVFAGVLKTNRTIKKLDFSYNRLSPVASKELLRAVADNPVIEHIRLRGNHLTEHICQEIAGELERNITLKHLDITNNDMDMSGVVLLINAMPECDVEYEGNFWAAEIANSISHGLGIVLSFIGGYYLIKEASRPVHPTIYLVSCWIFLSSLVALYTCSTLAHSFHRMKITGRMFVILDHSCIAVLIAGSYTPFSWVNLGHTFAGPALGSAEWILAVFAIVLSFQGKKYAKYELIVFLLMGWAAAVPFRELMACMQMDGVYLLALGGAFYTFGVGFYLAGRTKPMLHAVWHFMVLSGSISHYFCVLWYARPCTTMPSAIPLDDPLAGRFIDL